MAFLSTSEAESVTDLNLVKEFIRPYNRIATMMMQKEPLAIWYHPICSPIPPTIEEVIKKKYAACDVFRCGVQRYDAMPFDAGGRVDSG